MGDLINHLSLRKVIYTDRILLFKWINDPDVRKWSFGKDLIKSDVHNTWFEKKYNDPKVLMWIFEVNNEPSGMVRLEKEDSKVFLNYLIAPQSRGKRLASKMLKIAINQVRNYWNNFELFAYTLPENIASIKSLEKTGFSLKNTSKKCYVFHITDKKMGIIKK